MNFPHKDHWRGALKFSLICVWINGWVNTREASDLRRHRAHYDVIVKQSANHVWFLRRNVITIPNLKSWTGNLPWRKKKWVCKLRYKICMWDVISTSNNVKNPYINYYSGPFNTMRPMQTGRHIANDISIPIPCMKMVVFDSNFPGVESKITQNIFR